MWSQLGPDMIFSAFDVKFHDQSNRLPPRAQKINQVKNKSPLVLAPPPARPVRTSGGSRGAEGSRGVAFQCAARSRGQLLPSSGPQVNSRGPWGSAF